MATRVAGTWRLASAAGSFKKWSLPSHVCIIQWQRWGSYTLSTSNVEERADFELIETSVHTSSVRAPAKHCRNFEAPRPTIERQPRSPKTISRRLKDS